MAKTSIQLYSVRDKTQDDFLGTVQKIGRMGYDGVQFAGFFDTPATDLKRTMDEVGLVAAGSHMSYPTLVGDQLDQTLTYNHAIGNDLIICPMLPEEMRTDADAYKRAADTLNEIGQTCKEQGFVFGYHNHHVEFFNLENGAYGFDILFSNTDPNLVKIELDCYWALHAGYEPIDIMNQYKNRIVSLHMKDLKRENNEKMSTEIGTGELDIQALIEKGKEHQVEWFTVEQEDFDKDTLESAILNITNLKKLL